MWFKKQTIDKPQVLSFGFLGGAAEALYCFLVALLINFLGNIMPRQQEPSIFNFLLILLLLVFSVGVSGVLVFGYPVYLALHQKFIEGLVTALTTLASLVVIGILIFLFLIII